jgi:UDP-MurNAc hydroxylase
MKLTMVSHASVLIQEGPVNLLTDPWFVGEVFNESWSLLCEPAYTWDTLHGVTHLWISHEHPDHLNFPTLKAIPAAQKSQITLLYQQHFSARMVETLAKLGFKQVIELPLGRWVDIGPGVSVLCASVGSIDSLLAIRSRGVTFLNLNDCVMSDTASQYLAQRLGRVDVLTQFFFANWVGNPGEHVTAPDEVLDRMRRAIQTFRTRITVPFASFVYFSHQDNRHMNEWINTPERVMDALREAPTTLQWLYNGDIWSSEEGARCQGDAVARYQQAFRAIATRPLRSHPSSSGEELLRVGRKLVQKVKPGFPSFLLRRASPVCF